MPYTYKIDYSVIIDVTQNDDGQPDSFTLRNVACVADPTLLEQLHSGDEIGVEIQVVARDELSGEVLASLPNVFQYVLDYTSLEDLTEIVGEGVVRTLTSDIKGFPIPLLRILEQHQRLTVWGESILRCISRAA